MTARRLPRGRRGRAALVWAVGFFLAAQLGAGLLLDYVWPDVRSEWFARVDRRWRSWPEGPDVVCLGSSRFQAALVPAVMQAAFREELGEAAPHHVLNAAVPAGDAISGEFLLKRLLREGARPRMVVLEINPDMVNGYNDWFGVHIVRQMRWEDVPAYLPEAWQCGECPRLATSRLFPLFAFRREIRQFLTQPVPKQTDAEEAPIDWKQFIPAPPPAGEAAVLEARSREGAAWLQNKLKRYHIGGLTDTALERLLALCQAKRIDVLLVGVPVTSHLRALYVPEIDAEYRAYVARLCQSFSCRFVDCRDYLPDYDFTDVHHAQFAGGVQFSRRLTREVLAPVWRDVRGASPSPSQTAAR
jgi:hypothetical protein